MQDGMVNCTKPTLGLFSLGAAHLVFLLDSTVQSFLGDPHHFSVLDKSADSPTTDKMH